MSQCVGELKIGESFSSYVDVETFIKNVEKNEYIQLYKRDSKTLKSMAKTCPLKIESANKALVYYKLVYSCSKGGKIFKSKSTGKRKCSTFKENCQMNLSFTLSNDCQKLVLTKLINIHNHTRDEQIFGMLAKQRRLNLKEKSEVEKLKSLKCNKVLLKEYIKDKTGKNVLLRDISNIKGKSSETDLQKVLDLLGADSDSVVQIVTDETNELQGIYFQNKIMRQSFANYPELLLFDATYKLNNLRMPLYILMVIDGNGQGQVAATFLLQHETSSSISSMIKIFKSENPTWTSVAVIMTDKDFCERQVLQSEFQNATLFLCIFHVLKSFRTNITTTSMGINSNQKEVVLHILQKMVYSKTESDYEQHCKTLIELNFPLVTKYFQKNWHSCRREWVKCFTCRFPTFGVYTNNHLESFNQKIKGVCSKFSNLQDFYEDFLNLIKSVKSERELLATRMCYKRSAALSLDPIEEKYYKLITPFAFKHLQNNYKKSQIIEVENDENANLIFKPNFQVTESKCECTTYTEMTLPCAHIFMFRRFKNMDMYCEMLIPRRFLKETYIKNYVGEDSVTDTNININNNDDIRSNVCIKSQRKKEPVCTQQQKFKKAMIKCQQLATILSEMGQKDFNHHFNQLQQIINFWNSRQKVRFINDDEEVKDNPESPKRNETCEIIYDNDIFDDNKVGEILVINENNFTYGDKLNIACNNYCDNSNVDNNASNDIVSQKELLLRVDTDEISFCNNSVPFQENECSVTQDVISSTSTENDLQCKQINYCGKIDDTSVIVFNETDTITDKTKDDTGKIKIISQYKWQKGELNNNYTENKINKEENDIAEILPTIENVSSIKMPLKMKVRGRPKGNACTAIGLKKKMRGVQFTNKIPMLRQKLILLGIFNNSDFVNMILHENKIIKEIELPEYDKLDSIILEQEISLKEVEIYFTKDAFSLLEKNISKFKKIAKRFCKVCNEKVNKNAVRCSSCLIWLHKKCSCLNKSQKSNKFWFCLKCKQTV